MRESSAAANGVQAMTTATIERELIESGPAARELGVARETLCYWERTGRIAPPFRTANGRRIFTREQIEEIRQAREARKTMADAPDAA